MKRTLAVLALLAVVGSAWALTRYWSQSQALTATDPATTCTGASTSAGCGLDLGTFRGYRVCVAAATTATLTGGTMINHYYDYTSNRWGWNPSLTWTLTGGRSVECRDFAVSTPQGRVLPNTSAVTVLGVDGGTGGTTVTVSATGFYP